MRMAMTLFVLAAALVCGQGLHAQEISDRKLRLRVLLSLSPEAVQVLREAADEGDGRAMALLGEAYGLSFGGLHPSDSQAALWLGRAARAGQPWATAEASFFAFRARHEADIAAAAETLGRGQDALDKGGPAEVADPMLEHLARTGLAEAQILLARQYDTGRGAPADPQQAAQWFSQAAAAGNAEADRELGRAYAEGDGVPVDPAASLAHYRAAAEAGDVPAERAMGALSAHGAPGMAADPVEAMRWLALAGSRGDAVARQGFITLASGSDPDLVREALSRAAAWQPTGEP